MNEKTRNTLQTVLIAALTLLADQWTKYLIRTGLALRETLEPIPFLAPFFRIIYWKNTGVAFGMFQGQGWIIGIISAVIVILLFVFFKQGREGPAYLRTALGLQLGGAFGNLIDRLTLGYVVDFLWFGNFPVFNIADAAIVCGAGVMLIGMMIDEKREKAGEQNERTEN